MNSTDARRRGAVWVAGAALALALTSAPVAAGDPMRGAELFRAHCTGCHGANGRPVLPAAPDFTHPMALLKPDLTLLATVRSGRGAMPAYAGILRDRDILDIISHLRTLK